MFLGGAGVATLAGVGIAAAGVGHLIDKSGEAADDASTAAVKLAAASAVAVGAYLVWSKR